MKYLKQKETVFAIIFAVLMLVIDQFSKVVASNVLPFRNGITVIDKFLYFTYTTNQGAAWSILEGKSWFFIIVAFIAIILLSVYFARTKEKERLTRFGIILILSGTIGNLLDRMMLGYVRDFIDVLLFGYDFPIFNIADMCICLGVLLVCVEIFYEEFIQWKQSK